ncbi:hypothetical protein CJU89_6824 [Yarrowia sp. B02]|nr:hypothetical protein CJU89_6824 [Yarrowia sp. B02]
MNEGNTAFLYKAKASKKDKAAAKRERHHTKLSKRGGISKADLKRKKPLHDRPFDYGNPEKNEAAMRPVSQGVSINKGTPLPPADIDAIMADGATAKEIKRQQRQEARKARLRETETLAANLDDLLEPLKAENGGRTRAKLDHTPNPHKSSRGNEAMIKAETKRFNKILNSKEYQASPFASLQAFLKTQIPQPEPKAQDKKMHM